MNFGTRLSSPKDECMSYLMSYHDDLRIKIIASQEFSKKSLKGLDWLQVLSQSSENQTLAAALENCENSPAKYSNKAQFYLILQLYLKYFPDDCKSK